MGRGASRYAAKHASVPRAGTATRNSRLLLHPDSADGSLNELVELTAGELASSTEFGTNEAPPRIGAACSADRAAIRLALAPHPSQAHAPHRTPCT
jgi:hypothetical protein